MEVDETMKITRHDDLGTYNAKGEVIEGATIRVEFADLSLDEFNSVNAMLEDYSKKLNVPTHLQKLTLNPPGGVHSGRSPAEGNASR